LIALITQCPSHRRLAANSFLKLGTSGAHFHMACFFVRGPRQSLMESTRIRNGHSSTSFLVIAISLA
jgi:hypothetical protein